MTILNLGYMPEDAAGKVWKALHGETFMDFRVLRGLSPGGMSVSLETDYDGTLEEIAEMALHVLAVAL